MSRTSRRILIVVLLAALFVLGATVPIEQSISGPCRVQSAATWYIMRNGAGQIITGWERNLLGIPQHSLMMQFERPDVVSLDFQPAVHEGAYIRSGDTLLSCESQEGESRLVDLKAERNVASDEMRALVSGARDIDLEVAQHDFDRAEAELELAEQDYDRVTALHDSGYASASELQLAEATYRAAAAEAQRASAAVRALQEGSREQEVAVSESRIERLDSAIVNARLLLGRRQYISSPIDGIVSLESTTSDYLARVSRSDTFAVYVRIPESAVPYVRESGTLSVELDGLKEPIPVEISDIQYEQTQMPAAYAIALIAGGNKNIKVGMTGHAICSLGKQTLLSGARARLGRLTF